MIDSDKFYKALQEKGYPTLGALAKELKIHRNTIHYYLCGRSVFPEKLNKILVALELEPEEILLKKESPRLLCLEPIAETVDQLKKEFPKLTFILFGSRAKATAHKYADWDLGVFSQKGIPHEIYRKVKRHLESIAEGSPFFMDLTNLNRADAEFLKNISRNWIFLGGMLKDWLALNKKAAPWRN